MKIEEILTEEEKNKEMVKALIRHFKGPKKVAAIVKDHSGLELTKTQICSWYSKNIPLKYLVILLHYTKNFEGYDFYPTLFKKTKKV